jgi:copper chaperone
MVTLVVYPLDVFRSCSMNDSRTYTVLGLTCSHCVSSVREEVSEIPGVHDVDVQLRSGRLVVSGDGFVDEAVRTAVEHAGYEVVA